MQENQGNAISVLQSLALSKKPPKHLGPSFSVPQGYLEVNINSMELTQP